jgi:ABC-type amino acid transport substrate-binding protein
VGTAGCGVLSTSSAAGTFRPATRGVLTVVTSDVPTPGFWYGTAAHPTGGFEYELARLLAERFGLHAVRVRIELFPRVVEGDLRGADLALDLITPTSERESKLDFSTAYYTGPPAVVVRRGIAIPDLVAAESLRWGTIRASTFVDDIRTLVAPRKPIAMFEGEPQVLAALREGRIDASIFDLPLAVAIASHSGGTLEVAAELPSSELIAAALPKGSGNVQAVDSAIRAFIAAGTVKALFDRWVGSSVTDASIPLLHTTRS